MDTAESWDPTRLQDLASEAAKEKANLVRTRIPDEKADVTCRYVFVNKSCYSMLFSFYPQIHWRENNRRAVRF